MRFTCPLSGALQPDVVSARPKPAALRTGLVLFLLAGAAWAPARLSAASRPELALQSGHSDMIWQVIFSPDGRLLATAGLDTTIKLWDVATGFEARTLAGHASGVTGIAFSPDGRLLAAGDQDQTIKLWDVATGQELRTLTGQPDKLESVAFSPDGRWLVSRGARSTLLWDVATGRPLRTLGEDLSSKDVVAFSRDGRWVVWSVSGSVSLWEVATDSPVRSLGGHAPFAISLDGRWLATGGRAKTTKIWDVVSGAEVRTLADTGGNPPFTPAVLAFSPDGRRLATGSSARALRVWDVATGAEERRLEGHTSEIESLAFSPDGRFLASRGHTIFEKTIRVWDVASGGLLQTLAVPDESAFYRDAGALASLVGLGLDKVTAAPLAFNRDGTWLRSGPEGRTRLWETATGREVAAATGLLSPDWTRVARSPGKKDVVIDDVLTGRRLNTLMGRMAATAFLAFSPDGRWLASSVPSWGIRAQGDDAIRIWELATGRVIHRLGVPGVGPLCFSPDGRLLASGGQAMLWDVMAGREAEVALDHEQVTALAFSPDGRLLLTGASGATDAGDTAKLWEVATGHLLQTFPQGRDVQAVAFAPDGRSVVTAGEDLIKLWDVATGADRGTPRRGNISPSPAFSLIAFTPDARLVAAPEYFGSRSNREWHEMPHRIDVIDAATGRRVLTLPGDRDMTTAAVFSPDGRWLASSSGRSAKLWEVATGHLVRTFEGHSNSVATVAFSPDGRWLATGSADGSVRLWDAATGRQAALLGAMSGNAEWVVVGPDGLFDGSEAGMRSLVAWRFGNEVAPLEIFFNEFYSPGLLTEILSGRAPTAPRDLAQLDRRQPRVELTLAAGAAPSPQAVVSPEVKLTLTVAEALGDAEHPAGGGAQDVRLFRNGLLVRAWRGDVLAGKGPSVTLDTSVPIVAGENRLVAYAFSHGNIKSADTTLVVEGADTLKRPRTAHVLAIGIDRYANPGYNLAYAVADARAFAEGIKAQQSRLSAFARVAVVPLLDRDATKANILMALRRLAGREPGPPPRGTLPALAKVSAVEPQDAVFVYYAGHGTARGSRFYLIPHDLGYSGARANLSKTDLETILTHSISDLELEQAFEKVDAGRITLVIDACNSGQALEAAEKRRGPMNSKGLAQLAYEKGMSILTAAQGYQAALEASRLGHGLLTYALVEEGLKTPAADQAPRDGLVDVREWLDYATMRVPALQVTAMEKARELGHDLPIVEGEQVFTEIEKRSLQRPRVFYRREPEAEPLVLADWKGAAAAQAAGPVSATPPAGGVGTEWVNPKDGLTYVSIPAGSFEMGCVPQDSDCELDEKPRHTVRFGRAYWMGKTEVTVGAYQRYVSEAKRSMPAPEPGFNRGWGQKDHPIVKVDWNEARAFCQWSEGRLPSEAEWEYAARGGRAGTKYPGGDTISHEEANYGGTGGKDLWEQTAPVGSFAANGFGLHDLVGNVSEWVQDGASFQPSGSGHVDSYAGAPGDGSARTGGTDRRVARGGSWNDGPGGLRVSDRRGSSPATRVVNFGFRCVLNGSR